MYYLVRKDKTIKIVSNCEKHSSKSVVIANYCKNNNIELVENRKQINEQCKGTQQYTYQTSQNKYIILKCVEHQAGYVLNGYIEKMDIGEFEWVFYKATDLPLADLTNVLKLKVRTPNTQ